MGAFKVAQRNYCEFFTEGEWNEEKAMKKIGKYYTEERVEYIRRFYNCLLNSKKMNELGILYLTHSNLSVRKTVELYNRDKSEKKKLNPDTGKSRIISCANKVNNSFRPLVFNRETKEPLEWIIDSVVVGAERLEIIREAELQIDNFIEMFDSTGENKKDKIAVKIPAYAKVSSISEDMFDNFMEIIRPYSKREMYNVEKTLEQMREEVGYFNFLMTPGVRLTEIDRERRETLLRWLGATIEPEQCEFEEFIDI